MGHYTSIQLKSKIILTFFTIQILIFQFKVFSSFLKDKTMSRFIYLTFLAEVQSSNVDILKKERNNWVKMPKWEWLTRGRDDYFSLFWKIEIIRGLAVGLTLQQLGGLLESN